MQSVGFWKLVVARAVVFLGAAFLTVLAAILVFGTQETLAASANTYSAKVIDKQTAAEAGATGGTCRLIVDSSQAPTQSPAPARVWSNAACDRLPAAGSSIDLVFVDAATTRLATEVTAAGQQPDRSRTVWLLSAGAGIGWLLVIWLSARLRRLYREMDGAPPSA